MKIAAYCRVSTNSEDQENSFENQKNYFESKIEEQGHDLYAVYADQGISGTKLNRPQFNQMLKDAGLKLVIHDEKTRTGREHSEEWQADPNKEPLFEEIWIKNTSRFARNVLATKVLNELKAKKVYVRFVEQGLSTREESAIFTIEMMALVDSQESRGKSTKVKWGQERSLEQGKLFTQSKLYGYEYKKEENRLVKKPDESEVVKKIFELYSQGYGHRRISNLLEREGIKTRNGKRFCKNTIMRIIDNEKYAGLNNGGKWSTGQVYIDKHYAKVKDDYKVVRTDKIEPIVSEELFNVCREIKNKKVDVYNKKGVNRGYSKYSGKVFCGKCGAPYISNVDRGNKFYNCKTKKNRGTTSCDNLNVKEKRLDDALEWVYNNYTNIIDYVIEYSGVTFEKNKELNNVALQLYNYKENHNLQKEYENALETFKRIRDRYFNASTTEYELLKDYYEENLKKVDTLKKQISGEKTEKQILEERFCELYYTITYTYTTESEKPDSVEDMIRNKIDKIFIEDSFIYFSFKGLASDNDKAVWEKILYPHKVFDGNNFVDVSLLDDKGNVKPFARAKKGVFSCMASDIDNGKEESELMEEVLQKIPNETREQVKNRVKELY